MKTKLGRVAIAIGLLCSANMSVAGEGGLAAAISVYTDATGVTHVSAAMAVGKTTAYAVTASMPEFTEAIAVGSGGTITIDATTGHVTSVTDETATNLAVAQSNTMTGTVNIDADEGTVTGP